MKRFYFAGLENEELNEPVDAGETFLDGSEAAYESFREELYEVETDSAQALNVVQSNIELGQALSNSDNPEITPEETNLIRVSANLASGDTETDPSLLIAATESFMTRRAAIEAAEVRSAKLLESISITLSQTFKKLADQLVFIFSSFKTLRVKVEETKAKLSQSSDRNIDVVVPASRQLLIGTNQIDNVKELQTECAKMFSCYSSAIRVLSEFSKDTKFINIKTILSFNSDDNLTELYNLLSRVTSKLVDSFHMEPDTSLIYDNKKVQRFKSDAFMGNYYFLVKRVNDDYVTNTSRSGSLLTSMVGSYSFRSITDNESSNIKSFSETTSKSILISILDDILDTMKDFDQFSNFDAKLSHFLSVLEYIGNFSTVAKAPTAFFISGILKIVRALRSAMLINVNGIATVAQQFKQNVKFILRVCDGAR